tara:strand:- start:272 stop:526 length:255 start_codon:yes stop_codon:yes gene_type:complete
MTSQEQHMMRSNVDLSLFDTLSVDVKPLQGDNQQVINLNYFYPCTSGDFLRNRMEAGWQSISVSLDQLKAQKLIIRNVHTGLVI